MCVCLTVSLFMEEKKKKKKKDLTTSTIIRLVKAGMTTEKGPITSVQFPPRPLFRQEKSVLSGVKIFCNS